MMYPALFNTPILLLTYHRPAHTQRIFEVLKQLRPAKLFWAIDGAKDARDAALCQQVWQISQQIDWECELKALHHPQNLGCEQAVQKAVTWFFEHVEQGIIVEDDCLPHLSFFPFCQELLTKYQQNEDIMCISGVNYCQKQKNIPYSYYFSHYPQIWGWATWQRAWQHYQHSPQTWQAWLAQKSLRSLLRTKAEQQYWQKVLTEFAQQNPNRWELRWLVSIWRQKGKTIIPKHNLVSNIGFDDSATTTNYKDSWFANLPTQAMPFPLQHPDKIVVNQQADSQTFRTFYAPKTTLTNHVRNFAYRYLPLSWQKALKNIVRLLRNKIKTN